MNVGIHAIELHDAVQGARVPLLVVYPSEAETTRELFGAYALDVARDAAVSGDALPLVVISHGTGGTPLVYRDLALFLAREGFVVALPSHPGNTLHDDGLANTVENLANRPRHVRLVIDATFADARVGPHVRPARVGVIGHSMGGYTALAVAGGHPTARAPDGAIAHIAVTPDPRVASLVVLAPATPWFQSEGALRDVDVPVLLRTAEHDEYLDAAHGDRVAQGVRDPKKVDARVVAGAGHFAFMSAFHPSMVRPNFPPSVDPPGFSRVAYQPEFFREVVTFLRRTLA